MRGQPRLEPLDRALRDLLAGALDPRVELDQRAEPKRTLTHPDRRQRHDRRIGGPRDPIERA